MNSLNKESNIDYLQQISYDPYLNRGFGVRFSDVHQPKPMNQREIIVNRVRMHTVKRQKRQGKPNFLKINVKLAGAELRPMKRVDRNNR